MSKEISQRMSRLRPSTIREMLKVTADPSFISFSAGNPAAELFPSRELAEITAEIISTIPATALQYTVTEGYAPLRELTWSRYNGKYGIGSSDDEIIITSGAQQGIELAAKCLLNPGDTVICENPSFIGALNAFRSYNANIVGIPVDADGMDIDAVEYALKTEKSVKLIYTIPTFQNPTGVTMSQKRRERLLELAVEYDVMLLEDSPYFELSFNGEIAVPIKCMDTTGHVLYAGSYSKTISPGIRIGFVIGPKWLVSKMTVAKQISDVHSNMVFMIAVSRLLERMNLDTHLEKCRALYRDKCGLMLELMDEKFDKRVSYIRPGGGLFIWCDLPENYSGTELSKLAQANKVAIVPGMTFDVNEREQNRGFRLNFSVPDKEQIRRGISMVAESISGYLG